MDGGGPSRMTSSEHPAFMMSPDTYGGDPQSNSVLMPSSAGMMHAVHLSFNPMAPCMPRPTESSNSLYHGDASPWMGPGDGLSWSEPVKKKRGRPRKYGLDGSMALALNSPMSVTSVHPSNPSSEPTLSKRRGRPPGSGKRQQLNALGSPGIGFTPHIIIVEAGEDVASKIRAFSQQGPRTICVIAATGAVCNATLRQSATSVGTMTYEGNFEIVSLSGSFVPTENGGSQSRTGDLSVSLAENGGRVLGGVIAGMLMAVTPVQVVLASFITEGKKPKPGPSERKFSSASQVAGFGAISTSPPSHGTSSESSDNNLGSPNNQSSEKCHDNGQHVPTMAAYTSVSWPNQQRHEGEGKMIHN